MFTLPTYIVPSIISLVILEDWSGGEGTTHSFNLRPTNNVTKWRLSHALTYNKARGILIGSIKEK